MYLFFSFLFRYIVLVYEVLWPFYRHTLYLSLSLCWCMFFFSPILSCVVSFLPLYICFLLLVCNLSIFVSHKDALMSFVLKGFRNTSCQSLLAINSLLAKFSRVCDSIDLFVFNKWIWIKWFMTSLICSFVCYGFVMDCQWGRLLGHLCFTC